MALLALGASLAGRVATAQPNGAAARAEPETGSADSFNLLRSL